MLEDISWWTSEEYRAQKENRVRRARERQQNSLKRICDIFERHSVTWAKARLMSDADLLRLDGFGVGSLKDFRFAPDRPRFRVKMGRWVS